MILEPFQHDPEALGILHVSGDDPELEIPFIFAHEYSPRKWR